jgi:hypothetical protein
MNLFLNWKKIIALRRLKTINAGYPEKSDEVLGYKFITAFDKTRFLKMQSTFENDEITGKGSYPKSITKALEEAKKYKRIVESPTSFESCGQAYSI